MLWTDLLPEKWRASADLKSLEGYYKLENGGQDIAYVGKQNGLMASTTGTAAEEAKSTLGAKRKWHDKFRASQEDRLKGLMYYTVSMRAWIVSQTTCA